MSASGAELPFAEPESDATLVTALRRRGRFLGRAAALPNRSYSIQLGGTLPERSSNSLESGGRANSRAVIVLETYGFAGNRCDLHEGSPAALKQRIPRRARVRFGGL